MEGLGRHIYLIPMLPLVAAAIGAFLSRRHRRTAAGLAIGAMSLALVLSVAAFVGTLRSEAGPVARAVVNFPWLQYGSTRLVLGWVLDPLAACMLVMVSFVGLLIFIYSLGYMAGDANFTRFFCFLSLFAAAMLGLVIANSLLLLFVCWELVGLASYLLIGFWYHLPSAAAAAKKAFITTRVGDVFFFLGMLWLYADTGTLLFYDNGSGCLEQSALAQLVGQTVAGGMAASTVISLLIFCGAVGKSGQVPLHVWLPDAMEGPTPVSALIHAATMVAAGVFLVARVYPLMAAQTAADAAAGPSSALTAVTWVGAITAVFAASIAVAQSDLKRILAYSTVSQLGYMMVGLGVGGIAVGMFHLITHAFFKALLFLGAGSVIHGCHDEQDIRRMGGLRGAMPVTFLTYAVGMLALAGVPLFFSGFWSKDGILHAAHGWPVSRAPFYLGLGGAFLTAFYMTRQVCHVFFGAYRGGPSPAARVPSPKAGKNPRTGQEPHGHAAAPHESPRVMTVPLVILAAGAVGLGFFGTPAWPWFQGYLTGQAVTVDLHQLLHRETLLVAGCSAIVVGAGLLLGWRLYGAHPLRNAGEPDPLEQFNGDLFGRLRDKFHVDEFYDATVVRFNAACARAAHWLDEVVWEGVVALAAYLVLGLSWLGRLVDEGGLNPGFDAACGEVRRSGAGMSRWQNGQVQHYLRVIGVALTGALLILTWGCNR